MTKKTSPLTLLVLLSILAALFSGCAAQPSSSDSAEMSGTITISGAFALYPMMQRWQEEFQALYPDVAFDVSAGGAGKGMADTLAGIVDIGMVSREITPDEEAKGAYWVPVTIDAVVPTINTSNPVYVELMQAGLTQQDFVRIFITGELKTWGEAVGRPEITDEIHVYTRSDAAGAPETWAKYLGAKQEDLLGVGIFGDPGLVEAVANDPFGIGFNNIGYAYDFDSGAPLKGIAVLPIDVNENRLADPDEVLETKSKAVEMIAAGKYPSPPARALNLVTLQKPSGITRAFIEWILTSGQQFVGEAGYVPLTEDQLKEALSKVQ